MSDTSHNGIDLIVVPALSRFYPKFISNFIFFFWPHAVIHIHLSPFRFFLTYTRATQADYGQRLQDSSSAHYPGETEEEDDAQNVLQAGQVDAHEGPHLRALFMERCGMTVRKRVWHYTNTDKLHCRLKKEKKNLAYAKG